MIDLVDVPGGPFRVVLADPPWQYRNSGVDGAAQSHYQVASTAYICAMPVKEISARDAVLVLWATWPCLPDAMQVIKAWGFEYVTGFPWVKLTEPPEIGLWGNLIAKPSYGTGFWARGCSESILIARRKATPLPKGNMLGILCERMEHSRKPDCIYDYCEQFKGPYLEMFARRTRAGWSSWGNEVPE
jgi:N6-adenosine-specific RNA methylase IME4